MQDLPSEQLGGGMARDSRPVGDHTDQADTKAPTQRKLAFAFRPPSEKDAVRLLCSHPGS